MVQLAGVMICGAVLSGMRFWEKLGLQSVTLGQAGRPSLLLLLLLLQIPIAVNTFYFSCK